MFYVLCSMFCISFVAQISSGAGADAFGSGDAIMSRLTTIASAPRITASRMKTARMLVAPSIPLTTGLTARPTSEAVVSKPKPAPLAPDGMTVVAAVYAAVVAAPIPRPNTAVGSVSHQALLVSRNPVTPIAATAHVAAMTDRPDRRCSRLPQR